MEARGRVAVEEVVRSEEREDKAVRYLVKSKVSVVMGLISVVEELFANWEERVAVGLDILVGLARRMSWAIGRHLQDGDL